MTLKNIVKNLMKKCGYTIIRNENLSVAQNEKLSIIFSKKYEAETYFHKAILKSYQQWYDGQLTVLYEEASPAKLEKVKDFNSVFNAIATWHKIHQITKYKEDLMLQDSAFEKLKILDIGSGPMPSALCFINCEVYCLDPLLPLYLEAGYPFHIYDPRAKFVYGFSEYMPFNDHFFDAVISVNALDHVDDFELTTKEIKRVLKPGGKVRLHLHFHPKTVTEPLELNDAVVSKAFSWCQGFRKINESKSKRGYTLKEENETYSVWSNF